MNLSDLIKEIERRSYEEIVQLYIHLKIKKRKNNCKYCSQNCKLKVCRNRGCGIIYFLYMFRSHPKSKTVPGTF